MQNRTYEPRARTWKFSGFEVPAFNFAWSNESDRLVISQCARHERGRMCLFPGRGNLPRTRR
jgi:hypothetical protein